LAISPGIVIDKRQLLLGRPNNIQAAVFLPKEQRIERLRQIFEGRAQDYCGFLQE